MFIIKKIIWFYISDVNIYILVFDKSIVNYTYNKNKYIIIKIKDKIKRG